MRGAFARFAFYIGLVASTAMTYHYSLPFVVGVVLADLKGSGYLKRFQEWSRVSYISIEVIAVGFSLVMLCDQVVADHMETFLAPAQVSLGFRQYPSLKHMH
jgi:hypothetical protein